MSLNNSQMLPARVRNMRQMNDVLNAEDIILAEIERIIDEMYQRASLLHEELINEEWLENKLLEIVGCSVKIKTFADELLVEINFSSSECIVIDIQDMRYFLDRWLPAHLKYVLHDNIESSITNHELIDIVNVCSYIKIQHLKGYNDKEKYNLAVKVVSNFEVNIPEEKIDCLVVENQRNVQYYNGEKLYNGTTKYNAMIRREEIQ